MNQLCVELLRRLLCKCRASSGLIKRTVMAPSNPVVGAFLGCYGGDGGTGPTKWVTISRLSLCCLWL